MIKKIAFIGATGMLGKPVATELVKARFQVTALVRDEAKAKSLLPEGIQLLKGDLRNAGDLKNLFTNQDAVYINLNLKQESKQQDYQPEREGLSAIIQAAQQCKIKRIAFISSLVKNYQRINNFQWWVFDLKNAAIDKIRNSGIAYTIFYPSTFIENFRVTYRKGNRVLLAGKSEHKMYFIAGEDYGRQVARSFQILKDERKEYVVQGPEGFTADEAAQEFINHHTAEKLSIAKAPLGLLKFLGIFNQKINYGFHIVEALNKYPERFESEKTWSELGKPTLTLKEFAQKAKE